MLKVQLLCLYLIVLSAHANANNSFINNSAVILQYHHVSEHTPASTSISPDDFKAHLDWIKEHDFDVLSLPDIIENLKTKKPLNSSKTLAITFDDANRSVCDIAWPILKEYKLPFTLFISTEGVEKNFRSQCSWSQLKEIYQSGLMTLGNHSHQHLNMVSGELLQNKTKWERLVKNEIVKAQGLIESNIGEASDLFAYPYGEYNSELSKIVTDLGFIGIGQHSGAVGFESDFSALPRFPASGAFANLETLSVKLYSLAFPAKLSFNVENPIELNSNKNPPTLTLHATNKNILMGTNCFNGRGERLPSSIENDRLIVSTDKALHTGRHRYTCTKKSDQPNRFYWISHQWLVEKHSANWFSTIYKNLLEK